MARYKVNTPRFFGKGKSAKLYGPGTKRSIITVDKPYPQGKVPSGLELIKETVKAEKKATDKVIEVDRVKVKAAMQEMIKENDNLGTDGIPNVAPLEAKVKCKVGRDIRDELMKEINDKIEKDGVTFLGDKSSVETL